MVWGISLLYVCSFVLLSGFVSPLLGKFVNFFFAENVCHFCTFQDCLCVFFWFFMCREFVVRMFILFNTFCSPKFITLLIIWTYGAQPSIFRRRKEEKRVENLPLFMWLMRSVLEYPYFHYQNGYQDFHFHLYSHQKKRLQVQF